MVLTIELIVMRIVISLGAPTHVGSITAGSNIFAMVALTVYLLYVVPVGSLCIEGERAVILNSDFLLFSLLGGDKNYTMTGA